MLTSIILGLLRHALTAAGGALLTHGIDLIGGTVQIQHIESVVAGGAIAVAGVILSAAQKVKANAKSDYNGLNQ